MNREEIYSQVKSYIELSKSGLEIENPKLDFKSTWYNLKEIKGINEFLKDTSAIANTFGPDGLIIIGFDEKAKILSNVSFKDTGLNDTTYIIDLINRRVDRLFNINIIEIQLDGLNIGVIHIPPSIDKPHVIRNYQSYDKDGKLKEEQNKIFIRRGTQTYPASKYDIELMFYDRKNIVPEYKVQTSFHSKHLYLNIKYNQSNIAFNESKTYPLTAEIPITLENLGMRPVSIRKLYLTLLIFEDARDNEMIKLELTNNYEHEPITIHPGHIVTLRLTFFSKQFSNQGYSYVEAKIKEFIDNEKNLISKPLLLILSTGNQIFSDLTISHT